MANFMIKTQDLYDNQHLLEEALYNFDIKMNTEFEKIEKSIDKTKAGLKPFRKLGDLNYWIDNLEIKILK